MLALPNFFGAVFPLQRLSFLPHAQPLAPSCRCCSLPNIRCRHRSLASPTLPNPPQPAASVLASRGSWSRWPWSIVNEYTLFRYRLYVIPGMYMYVYIYTHVYSYVDVLGTLYIHIRTLHELGIPIKHGDDPNS